MRLTAPLRIEGTSVRLTAPLWIEGVGVRLIEGVGVVRLVASDPEILTLCFGVVCEIG
jgi:hypothetical protein